jgi:mono/diheme cytochrome c family protein
MTGLDGTPMPSYAGVLDDQQSWDLVSYCLELMKGTELAQR